MENWSEVKISLIKLLIGLVLCWLFVFSLYWIVKNIVEGMDKAGGVKAIIERVWEGASDD